jgi:hypothetical protein
MITVLASQIRRLTEAELVTGGRGYRKGFTHGVQTVIDMLWKRMNRRMQEGVERILEIAMRMRFDRKVHAAFSDDLRTEFARLKRKHRNRTIQDLG